MDDWDNMGRFTLWTVKSDHGRGLFSMVWVLKSLVGPVTRCKPNADQEEWPCTIKWMCWIFLVHAQKGQFRENFRFDHFLVYSWVSLVITSCYKCRRCGLQIFSQQFLQKISDLICTCDVYLLLSLHYIGYLVFDNI